MELDRFGILGILLKHFCWIFFNIWLTLILICISNVFCFMGSLAHANQSGLYKEGPYMENIIRKVKMWIYGGIVIK